MRTLQEGLERFLEVHPPTADPARAVRARLIPSRGEVEPQSIGAVAGGDYERQVWRFLQTRCDADVRDQQGIEFESSNQEIGRCLVDLLLIEPKRVVAIECKTSLYDPEGSWQQLETYLHLLALVCGPEIRVRGILAIGRLRSEQSEGRELVVSKDLEAAIEASAESSRNSVWIPFDYSF